MPDEQIEILCLLVRARVLEARGFPVTDDARCWRPNVERQGRGPVSGAWNVVDRVRVLTH